MTTPLRIGILGDGFMKPAFFRAALEARLPGRALQFTEAETGWPLERLSTKYDPSLPIGEFVGRPEEYFGFLQHLDVLITHLAPVVGASMDQSPDLKIIAVSRGGPVNVDLAAARARGITVLNTPGRNASAVAEFTVGSLIAETRNLIRGHVEVANGTWSRTYYHHDHVGPELCEMTVGIVGYGDIGTRVAKLLHPFGCRILIYDPFKELTEAERAMGFEKADLDDLLARSDAVTLHPRVTPETKGMISRARIARMKPGSYIVNTTRGQVLDYDALYDALVSGHLKGAVLDTFEQEPPAMDMPLLKLPNVTLSPHIAGASRFAAVKCAGMIAEDIARILDGQAPLYPST